MIFFCKRKKYITTNQLKLKYLKDSLHKKYNLLSSSWRQFYQSSKIIMKSYHSQFLSESDSQEIGKLVSKKKNTEKIELKQSKSLAKSDIYQQGKIPSETLSHGESESQQQRQFKLERHLACNMQNKKKLVYKIVKLYQKFFNERNCVSKAEEIMHIYKKKLCQDNSIAPTLFCWLHDWINKEFSSFIKNQMNDLSHRKDPLQTKNQKSIELCRIQKQSHKLKTKIESNQLNSVEIPLSLTEKKQRKREEKLSQREMFLSVDLSLSNSKQQLYQKISMIKNNSGNELNQNEMFIVNSRKDMLGPIRSVFVTIQGKKQKQQEIRLKLSLKDKQNLTYETSNLLPFKKQHEDSIKKQISNEEFENQPINRQILIGAYYNKYYSLYKSMEGAIPDLDIQYVKQIRRNDRKAEVKKRIKEICRVLIRNQPLIKVSIDDYDLYYWETKKHSKKALQQRKEYYTLRNSPINETGDGSVKQISHQSVQQGKNKSTIASQKKISSNLLQTKQKDKEFNHLQRLYQKKRLQRQKQTLSMNRPIAFQFNLPRIPQRSSHTKAKQETYSKAKQKSKIFLIQSGRYKLLDTLEERQMPQSSRKNKINDFSLDMSQLKQQISSSVVQQQTESQKKLAKLDERSALVLEMITKKKRKSPNLQHKKNSRLDDSQEAEEAMVQQLKKQSLQPPKRMSWRQQKILSSFKQIPQNFETNDYELISGWEKGRQTPMTS